MTFGKVSLASRVSARLSQPPVTETPAKVMCTCDRFDFVMLRQHRHAHSAWTENRFQTWQMHGQFIDRYFLTNWCVCSETNPLDRSCEHLSSSSCHIYMYIIFISRAYYTPHEDLNDHYQIRPRTRLKIIGHIHSINLWRKRLQTLMGLNVSLNLTKASYSPPSHAPKKSPIIIYITLFSQWSLIYNFNCTVTTMYQCTCHHMPICRSTLYPQQQFTFLRLLGNYDVIIM